MKEPNYKLPVELFDLGPLLLEECQEKNVNPARLIRQILAEHYGVKEPRKEREKATTW